MLLLDVQSYDMTANNFNHTYWWHHLLSNGGNLFILLCTKNATKSHINGINIISRNSVTIFLHPVDEQEVLSHISFKNSTSTTHHHTLKNKWIKLFYKLLIKYKKYHQYYT